MKKFKEMLSSTDIHILSEEEQKVIKGGGFWCHCGDSYSIYVDDIRDCLNACQEALD